MRAKEAKTISICNYLSREGHSPLRARLGGREQWYSSPLRAGDSNPSFKVDAELNLWFDHGLAIGGDVINLVCELHKTSTKEALAILEASGLASDSGGFHNSGLTQSGLILPVETCRKCPAGEKEKEEYFEITKVSDIHSPVLLQYLKSRKIDLNIAKIYLKEIRFKPRNQLREYFALGWPNGNGFEARSKLFKGFVGTSKDITRIGLADDKDLAIFEGFFDYLAYLSHHKITTFQSSAIILNSTALRKRALAEIKQFNFSKVYLFLDNDIAGSGCKSFFMRNSEGVKVVDCSHMYEPQKDFNEWLIEKN